MSSSRSDEPESGAPERSARSSEGASEEAARTSGSLEALFQELIRRGASLGFSSLFLTEEAIRRAFSDTVPPDWLEYLGRQGKEARHELVERLSLEFGNWLRAQDPVELFQRFLEDYEISVKIEVSAKTADAGQGPSLQVFPRRK